MSEEKTYLITRTQECSVEAASEEEAKRKARDLPAHQWSTDEIAAVEEGA